MGRRTAAEARRYRRTLCGDMLGRQAGVASRRQLYAAGLRRWDVSAELKAGRWVRSGPQTIRAHGLGTALDDRARWWIAVLEIGSRAALDGVTALLAAGLKGFDEEVLHISMPKSGRPRRWSGVRVHETRRRQPGDLVDSVGIPRVRPGVAAVRGALWARSDRQAALILVMSVQQRITTAADLAEALSTVKRHHRRRLLAAVVADITDGAQSLGELDFARLCRAAGLPEPDRQSLRRLAHGLAYLDVEWAVYGVVAEIDGIHHADAPAVIADALRQNEIATRRSTVLRIPVVGLRTEPARFMSQVRNALLSAGWTAGHLASEGVASG